MKNYPLLMTYRGAVSNGLFEANVVATGRLLASHEIEEEASGFWLYGVNPGAIAASGETLPEGLAEFHNTYNAILFDLAAESETFDIFKAKAEEFFFLENTPNAQDWDEALAAVRSGIVTNDLGLPRASADARPLAISITLRTSLRSDDFNREAPALAA
jgi:hypothetical protein